MDNCAVCGGQEFYLESGYYFCKECQTQQEGKREEVVDFNVTDNNVRLRKTKIRKQKIVNSEVTGWTSWEKYNFILIGLTNQLIELGASPNIKLTILQLWATYLGKLEVAFTSTEKQTLPKLSRVYHKKDAMIIYGGDGKPNRKKLKKTDRTSVVGSAVSSSISGARELQRKKKALVQSEYEKYRHTQEESDVDHLSVSATSVSSAQSGSTTGPLKPKRQIQKPTLWLNKCARQVLRQSYVISKKVPKPLRKKFQQRYIPSSYIAGPQVLSLKKLWSILYLALRINNEQMHMSDMIRWSREGHLSYYRLENLLPADVSLTTSEMNRLNSNHDLTYKGLRTCARSMAKLIEVWQYPHPNLLTLLRRFCTELQLPDGIFLYAERLMAASPPVMEFTKKCVYLPNYEARVMAIIIVVMKILFGLDGITEYQISKVIERINLVAARKGVLDAKLFNFREWQRYIECRRSILVNEHLPTKLKRDPTSTVNSHLYFKFIESIQSKQEIDENEKKPSHYISNQLANALKQKIERLTVNDTPEKKIPIFPPSLTPQNSYLQQLLQDPDSDLPSILRHDFPATKVGYLTSPESLQELAAQCGIEVNYIDRSPHFAEKIVPTFEPGVLPSISEQRAENMINELTRVVTPDAKDLTKTENSVDPAEYLHRKNPGIIHIDTKKLRLYNKIERLKEANKKYEEIIEDNFDFDQVDANGRLNIPDDDDDDDNSMSNNNFDNSASEENYYNLDLSEFEKQTLKAPVENPWNIDKIYKRHTLRKNGRFVSRDNVISNTVENTATTIVGVNNNNMKNVDEITIEDNDITDNGSDSDSIIVEEAPSTHDPAANDTDDEISILTENIVLKQTNEHDTNTVEHEQLVFFRSFKEYWIRRSHHFIHITSQNFRLLERNFPTNFRWLLHECAHILEMTVDDLYSEVCLVENYYGCVLSKNNNMEKCKKYNSSRYRAKEFQTSVKNKWYM